MLLCINEVRDKYVNDGHGYIPIKVYIDADI